VFKPQPKDIKSIEDLLKSIRPISKEQIDDLMQLVHRDAKEKGYPIDGFNHTEFVKLFPLILAAAKHESKNTDAFQEARVHTLKLIIVFGTFEQALNYLKLYESRSKLENRKQEQLVHDACLFNLPTTNNWNIDLWRQIVFNHSPARENDLALRLFSNADKIEKYVIDNIEMLKTENHELVASDFEKRAADDFTHNESYKEQGIDAYIESNLQKKYKVINREVEHEFDLYMRKELGLPLEEKFSLPSQQVLSAAKKNLSPQYIAKRKEMENNIKKRYQQKFADEYAGLSQNKQKHEYIKQRLESSATMINTIASELNQNILTTKTPITTIYKYAKSITYKNANKNPEAAAIFFENQMQEKYFDEYLKLKSVDDPQQIPALNIVGEIIDPSYKGYYLKKLSPSDPRAAILGKYTSCCQSLGEAGGQATAHGITSPRGGFYVLCKMSGDLPRDEDTIVAQSWAWRGHDNSLVFDSIESQVDFRSKNETMIRDIFMQASQQLVKEHNIPKVQVGSGGNTPKNMGFIHLKSHLSDYGEYRDSLQQDLIAEKGLLDPMLAYYKTQHPDSKLPTHEYNDIILSRDAAFGFLDYLYYAQFSLLHDASGKDTNLDLKNKEDRIPLLKKWRGMLSELTDDELHQRLDLLQQWKDCYINFFDTINETDIPKIEKLLNEGMRTCFIDLPVNHSLVGKQKLIQLLLNHGFSPNITTRKGVTILLQAAEEEQWDLVLLLIKQGANINATSRYGYFCIDYAALKKNWGMIKTLIELGANADRSGCMLLAIEDKNWEVVQYIIDKNKDNPVFVANEMRSFELCKLIEADQMNLAKQMVDCGVNPNGPYFQDQPYQFVSAKCCEKDRFDFLKDIIPKSVDVNLRVDRYANSLLHYLANRLNADDELLNLVLSKTSNVDMMNTSGETPLQIAAVFRNFKMIQGLIDHGANTTFISREKMDKDVLKFIDDAKSALPQQNPSDTAPVFNESASKSYRH
jgi:ankyrin repeat protein